MKLKSDFYLQSDVVELSRQLLGKVLCSRVNDQLTAGIICETEAYAGVEDKASHAYGNRRTRRTETMYMAGGVAYIYLCYGIHHLFNVVTNQEGIPHAVLIRGIIPLEGKELILQRRNASPNHKNIGIGPGKVSQALGLTTAMDQSDLCGDEIWIEERGIIVESEKIISSPRVGVDYAEEDALLPYRFQYLNF
jgi:DNA-3-methyladenine glycosylase